MPISIGDSICPAETIILVCQPLPPRSSSAPLRYHRMGGGGREGEWICSRSVSRSVKVSSDVAIARSLLRIRPGTAVIVRRRRGRLEKLTDERTQSEAGFNRSVDYISKLLLEIIVFRKLFPWICGNWELRTCVDISLTPHISFHP